MALRVDQRRLATYLAAAALLSSCSLAPTSVGCEPAAPQQVAQPGASSAPAAEAQAGATWQSSRDGMILVYVPAGEFLMGAAVDDPVALEWDKPEHLVYLDAFWIDSTEVANAMYALCVADGSCSPPAQDGSFTRSSYHTEASCGAYPVVHVSWDQAQEYCQWAGRRLATEAEWEKAARGTDGRLYPWGDEEPTGAMANLCGIECRAEPNDPAIADGFVDTAPVGYFPADSSPYGALDMAGNVSEWVADRGDDGYYAVSPASNPTGPTTGDTRVIRGGLFGIIPRGARVTVRSFLPPYAANEDTGFRCAASIP